MEHGGWNDSIISYITCLRRISPCEQGFGCSDDSKYPRYSHDSLTRTRRSLSDLTYDILTWSAHAHTPVRTPHGGYVWHYLVAVAHAWEVVNVKRGPHAERFPRKFIAKRYGIQGIKGTFNSTGTIKFELRPDMA